MVKGLVERIVQLRKQKELSQTALAKELGLSRSSVNGWESESSQPSPEVLIELSKFFGVSVDYLLGNDKYSSLNVSGLTDSEVHTLLMVIDEFKKK